MKAFGKYPTTKLPKDLPPQLVVVIDTEEEFDWSASPDRSANGVTAMSSIERVQEIFDEYGIVPCYVVDYPVVSQKEGYLLLANIHADSRCEIGAHLHPWVNPPFDEQLSSANTYAGNLPRQLEQAKLRQLRNKIEEVFNIRPSIYKAGRYGIGHNTPSILHELGFDIDLSVCPPVDFRADGGPDFRDAHAEPFWYDESKNLLEIPVTGAFVGWLGGLSSRVYDYAGKIEILKAKAILSRLLAVDRLMLSPEGFGSQDHIKLTDYLFRRGVRTFTWSFHSTSVEPGMAPYVRNIRDLELFLDSFRRYFDYYFGAFHGEATTPTRLKRLVEELA